MIDLTDFPTIFVLPTHLSTDEIHKIEDDLEQSKAHLTYDPLEARVFIGRIGQARRAAFELSSRNIHTQSLSTKPTSEQDGEPDRKKHCSHSRETDGKTSDSYSTVSVITTSWLEDSMIAGYPLLLSKYVVYEGAVPNSGDETVQESRNAADGLFIQKLPPHEPLKPIAEDILARARKDASIGSSKPAQRRAGKRDRLFAGRAFASSSQNPADILEAVKRRPNLARENTAEHDAEQEKLVPEMPDWIKNNVIYSCARATPSDSPNEAFISKLKSIRLARILTDDQIGVRAYSTSIAAVAAYPHPISSPREIIALPGCDTKVSSLWTEWKANDGIIAAAAEAENDEQLKVLRLFYEIWGVGALTAREFYFERGWRDLDDIVEHGWNTLTRVQQIGVKYYDEFQEKIPRAEVEFIASVIRQHAIKVRGQGVEMCIVGGYRRGKTKSGDVDVIISHRDSSKTLGIAKDIVESLKQDGWITHTLLLSQHNTHRGQATLPFRSGVGGGHGFDTLDKALVVWQDPRWDRKILEKSGAKNPNIHRRVDIIISPWHTIGCAVMGWSGGTTFQRDVRRYAKRVKGWKFDSSGVRNRGTGAVVDLEGPDDDKVSCEDAEKKVFEGLGLVYRDPWDRCTG